MYRKLHVTDLDVSGKHVLTRVDFNAPLTPDGAIADDTRIRRALPTIRHIVESGGKVVLASHMGRPKGRIVPSMSLKPAAAKLAELLGREVMMAPDCVGDTSEGLAARMGDGDVMLLENLRFHGGETSNERDFARRLGHMGDLFVNDAF
ncbi:MAG: phosphoglycerate kinase, partial [Candidatus Eisenbacteria bacterium]|nr:phosphoglycerate kinase [Candidatus Eisenbacteria bacterium]